MEQRVHTKLRLAVAVSALACAAIPAQAAIEQPVKVQAGLVAGVAGREPSITAFKGIPFAAPPVGDLRWRAPQSAVPWQGIRKADLFSASCIQAIVEERPPWTYEFMAHNEISEDCLYLNLWTPATSSKDRLPVFVYVYGGGFVEGSAAVPVYDGEGMARKGLVAVTFNYRLGPFGYLAHPDLTKESGRNASGNYGSMDQLAALHWLHDNVAAFGGDPDRVTIAGQSAGAISVHDLVASPLAKGLFQRAVTQSGNNGVGTTGGGPMMPHGTRADAEALGQRFAESLRAHSLAELRALRWQTIQEAAAALPPTAGPLRRFVPIVDGYFLPSEETGGIAGGARGDVAALAGATSGELSGNLTGTTKLVTLEEFREQARQRYADLAREFLELYPATTDETARAAQEQSARDRSLVAMYLWAKRRSHTAKTSTFLYLWDHALPGPDANRFGAFHSSEVPYVLNTLPMSHRPFSDADHRIADTVSSYWANFARSGDPNGKGLPPWPAVEDQPMLMRLGDEMAPVSVASSPARFEFFEKLLSR